MLFICETKTKPKDKIMNTKEQVVNGITIGECNVDYTHLKGKVKITYADLIERIGEPTFSAKDGDELDDKARAVWHFKSMEGDVATLYDYKETEPIEDVELWQIGGHDVWALQIMEDVLGIKIG